MYWILVLCILGCTFEHHILTDTGEMYRVEICVKGLILPQDHSRVLQHLHDELRNSKDFDTGPQRITRKAV